jgi:Amt family ammonium transporter
MKHLCTRVESSLDTRKDLRVAMRKTGVYATLAVLMLCCCLTAFGQTPAAPAAPPKVDTGDTAWMLVSTALVMLMTPGLALFYGGMVRAKNVLNMLMQSFIAVAIVTVVWVVGGYSLAFAKGSPFVGGFSFLGLSGVGQEPNAFYGATIPHQVFMMYQMMFAIITPALISGAIADRMKFSTYVVFITLWSLIVYSPLAHMVWGEGGFLRDLGALDFAGGTVVHISSGVSALVLCIVLGKRQTSATEDMRPHNLPMTLIGTGLLWFGWFGFNAGSAIASGGLSGSAFMVTHIAAAVAGLTWVLIEWLAYKRPTALGLATGAVAGLVAITPASGFVGPMAAIVIGAGVSCISFFAIKLKEKFHYDDSLDVFGVHGVGGMWGALATGLFATTAVNAAGANGLFYGNLALVGKQLAGIGIAVAWAAVVTFLLAHILKATMGLRVDTESELVGLDLSQHGESGYAGPSTGSDEELAAQSFSTATSSPAGAVG